MSLGVLLLANGNHLAGWRQPAARPDRVHDIRYYQELAQTAERACFDLVFLADSVGIRERGGLSTIGRTHQLANFEPLTLLSALSVLTEHIGLVATASTTYNEPYHVARKFASLDHLSNGRAGWNVVTSFTDTEAFNFGAARHLDHDKRYARASEFVEVVQGLWDSWDDDAFVHDKSAGVFADMRKMHLLAHKGAHFSVRGPLNIARAPQGHPVIFQAGASDDGQDLAASTAEVVFTAADTLETALQFSHGLRERVAAAGRDASQLRIMPGIFAVVGETAAEAQEKHEALQSLIDPALSVALLSAMIGADLSGYPLDETVPALPSTNAHRSRQLLLLELAARERMTVRQLARHAANAVGHKVMVGSAAQIADELSSWFEAGAADGFNLLPASLPTGLEDFARLVVPLLQRRGLFRDAYRGNTLRDHLGLARTPNRATRSAADYAKQVLHDERLPG
ncbi:MAG: LLM class flavin-dependent oxidoreductase [Janthinobacterium lividum]